MTAQEAAKKQTRFYRWLAAIFATGGLTALGGLYFDEIKLAAGALGGSGMAISVLTGMLDWYSKKTGAAVSGGVEELRAEMKGMREAHNTSAAAILNLATVLSSGDQERREMHAQNLEKTGEIAIEIHEVKEQLSDHAGAIVYIGDHLAKGDSGFRLPPIRKQQQPKPQ